MPTTKATASGSGETAWVPVVRHHLAVDGRQSPCLSKPVKLFKERRVRGWLWESSKPRWHPTGREQR